MPIRKYVLPISAGAVAVLAALGVAVANLDGASPASGRADIMPGDPQAEPVYLVARMLGRNEVPAADGKATNDPDGKAVAVLRIHGNVVEYGFRWKNIAAPTAGHVHKGVRGQNGDLQVPFFGSKLPTSSRAVAGHVTADPAFLARLRNNPGGYYANLHTQEFPGGAVRGQFRKVTRPVNPRNVLLQKSTIGAKADGAQEVPAPDGAKVGDPDGVAGMGVWPWGSYVDYAFSWRDIAPPTVAHIHRAPSGQSGPPTVPLFASELPESVTGISGRAPAKPEVVQRINANPANYYGNLHTKEFPGGAVRGQLARLPEPYEPERGYLR